MSLHPLDRPLIVEPPLSPPDDPPCVDCRTCDLETDEPNENGNCPSCAELLAMEPNEVARFVAEMRDDLETQTSKVARLRREIARLGGDAS